MDMSLHRRFGSGTRALLVGLGVLGGCVLISLMNADVSFAAAPEKGLACNATEGKISGRGASYQAHAEAFFAGLYETDFCGATPGSPTDAAGNTMVAYNYSPAEADKQTGAGAGIKAASCRTDAYAGDSLPYTEAQYTELNEAPGKTKGCTLPFQPPFAPQGTENAKKEFEFPSATDTTAPVMTVPIAGSSIGVAANLAGACKGGTPTGLEFSAKEISRLFGGDAATWSDSELEENNPSLKTDECTGAITRVVREDSAGTTEIFKAYLVRAAPERSGAGFTCAVGKAWSEYTKTNTQWPGKQSETEGTCSKIITPANSGGPEEVAKIRATEGGIGYADLPDLDGNDAGLITATVQNATTKAPQAPNSGKAANCSLNVLTLPGATANDAVGLNAQDNWGTNNTEVNGNPNHQNATDLGSKYPICGVTFDLVYTGLDNNNNTNNAITPLTADQRRTLYSYFTFVLSSTAQSKLSTIDYNPLPSAWLEKLTEGFQANF